MFFAFRGKKALSILIFLFFLFQSQSNAQSCTCGGTVPTIIVDVSANPDTTIQLSNVRNGHCCSGSGSDRCIKFIVTVNPQATEFAFGIKPGNDGFYQIDCGTPVAAGTPACIAGLTTFCVTYCKPGGNSDTYTLTSSRGFTVSPTKHIRVGGGCNAMMVVTGLTESTINWTSVYPGAVGAYNSYLSCTTGCDTTYVNPTAVAPGTPSYIDYKVCGTSAGCVVGTVCDTIRVYTYPAMPVNITPASAVICSGGGGSIVLTANVSGGHPPYTYSWTGPGGFTSTLQSPTVSVAGTYTVAVSDSTDCPPVTATRIVTAATTPTVTSSANDIVCSGNPLNYLITSTVLVGTTYSWTRAAVAGISNPAVIGQTSNPITETLINMTTSAINVVYLITPTANGCTGPVFTLTVKVFPTPVGTSATTAACGPSISLNYAPVVNVASTLAWTSSVLSGSVSGNTLSGTGNITDVLTNLTPLQTAVVQYTIVPTASLCPGSAFTYTVTLYPLPSVNFNINNSSQCLTGNNFTFTNTSTLSSGTMTYSWNFGDGGTSISTSPSHSYASPGTYNVKLIATTNNGCKDSIIKIVTVSPQPVANFTINTSSQCLSGNSFAFTNTSTVSSGTMTYSWTFGDGGTTTATNPTYLYSAAGTYNVKLVVTTDQGCKDSITKTVTVFPQPSVNFNINTTNQCLSGNSFVFTNTSSVSSGTISYSWTFGDGGTSTLANPSHTYASAGTYNVKLVVTTNNGCKDSITKSVTVYPQSFVHFTINNASQCLSNNTVNFTNLSSVSSGTITYSWTFGDGGTSTATSPSHTYAAAGSYNVKLVVTTNNGCKDSVTKTVTIYPQPIVGYNINTSNQCLSGNIFTFTNTSSVSSGTLSYSWTFGDGGISTATSPSHTYAAAGTYNIKLIVTTNNGCKDSVTQTVTVYPQSFVDFSIDNSSQCLSGNTVNFTNLSTVSSGTITYSWTFGNGGTSTLVNPAHTYAAYGTYNIKLVVTTNNGCKDSVTKVVNIFPQPVVNFNINNAGQCLSGNSFTFTSTSTVGVGTLSYNWSFGNGATSTLQNPTYTYPVAGTYNVKLVVTTNNGCKDSITKTITVYPQPAVDFNINTASQCLSGNSFVFTNLSTVSSGTMTYSWTFGDGGTSTLQNASHVYTTPGTYQVKLVVTTNNGCKDSITKQVAVFPQPAVSFTINTAAQCLSGNSFSFTNGSTVSVGSLSYNWTFGDGGASTQQNPTYTYAAAGTYNVKLVVTTNDGCKDSLTQVVTVYPQPVVGFTINNATQCLSGNNVVFTNTSTVSAGTITYSWTFGDGGTSTLQNPSHIYTTAGTYTVKLIVTTNNGCKDSVSQNVTIYPQSSVNFNINTIAQCLSGNSFSFTNTSTISSGSLTYSWTFGDGGSSTLTSPSHIYVVAGTYNIKLVVTSDNGCKDSITKSVTVYPQPAVDYTINNTAQCLSGNNFIFTNASTVSSGSITYSWTFGDGGISTLQNAQHTYTAAGTYNVKLLVTTNNGCKDSLSKTVTVYPQPSVDFNISNAGQCLSGNNVTFTNTSTVSSGTITYNWTFGDGGTSTLQNPTHTYTVSGTYNVKLVVTTDNGCKDSVIKSLTIYPQPVVNFTINTASQCLSGNNFTFTSSSTVSSGSITYTWTFGDGGSSTLQNPSHTYAAAGTYNVKLIVTTNNGCKDSLTQSITVYPQAAIDYSISPSGQCLSGNNITFINLSTISSGTLNYNWNFGDGNTSTQTSPSHTYAASGTYNVKLVSTSNNGCKDSITKTVTIYPQPVVNFNFNNGAQCLSGNNFVFTSTSTVTNGTLSYNWYFGDGGTSSSQNPSYSYTASGTYNVKLVVTTDNGCKDSITKAITVYPQPVVDFNPNASSQCLSGNNFVFTNLSTISSGTMTYSWNFGDGGTSSLQNASHTYTTAGTYNVKLVVTSGFGCKDSIAKTVTVYLQPVVGFNVNTNAQCLSGNSFTFTNNSTISSGTLTYNWTFGDGGTSTLQSPSHTYASAGIYPVKLVVATNNGCKDSVTINVTVYPQPSVGYTINDSTQCLSGNNFIFTNNSSVSSGTITYNWTFGDGGASTLQNAQHTYAAAGTYTVKLVVTTNNGCKDSISKTVVVYPQAAVNFNINNAAQCLANNTFGFTNTSTISSGSLTYSWTFGDGGTSTLQNPSHTYVTAGTYNVKLVVTSDNGCLDSITKTVTVYPQPSVAFAINSGLQCLSGNNFVFNNNSTVSSGTITYSWTFGDGGTSTLQNPSHVYSAAGTYAVKLVVTTNQGCVDSATATVTVFPQPAVNFNINNAGQCLSSNNVSFTNTSTVSSGSITYSWTFGDGGTSTLQNPTHTYTIQGTYNVKLVVTTDNGCKDSITKPITIFPQPSVSFNISTANQCLSENNFVFTSTSTVSSGSITYSWTFGDGGTSTLQNPSHSYVTAGTYNIKLVVTTNNGCKDSLTQSVIVYPQATVDYTVNTGSQCLSGNNFVFTSSVSGGTVNTYSWTFGDGGTSSLQNPSHSYTLAGTYNVKLVVTTDNGCKDSVTKTVMVYPQTTVNYNINTSAQCLTGNNFVFTSSVLGSTVTGYSWTFGDGGTSTVATPSHSYTTAGSYNVKLVVITNNGCIDSIIKPVIVYPQTSVDFAINSSSQCLSGNNFAFTSSVSGSTVIAYNWNFDDGGTSTFQNATHTYTAAGTYSVRLIVTTNNGCQDTIIKSVTVYPQTTLNYSINSSNQCLRGNSFVFNSTVSGSTVSTYYWTFGDSSSDTIANTQHVYASAGTYIVKLLITTNNGCKDSVTRTVIVYPQAAIDFAINSASQCLSGNNFIFTSSVSGATVNTYNWNFGDGGTSFLQNAAHTYAAPGTYTVTLITTTNNGCTDTVTKTVIVYSQTTANYTINNAGQCLDGNSFAFISTVSGSTVTTYSWTFGDGGTDTAANPVHSYTAAGSYNVKLVVTTNNGCKDSVIKQVVVYPQPSANFNINSSFQCLSGNNFIFTNTSTISSGSMTYNWNFGDGGSSTLQNAQHSYSPGGVYSVRLISTSNFGCVDTITKPVTVYPVVPATFTINGGAQCLNGNNFIFTNTDTSTSPTLSYVWTFGDGGTATTFNATHTYAAAGTYFVKLLKQELGCADSSIQTVTVYPQANIGFNINNNSQCLAGNSFTFTNTTSISSGSVSYQWTFDDGATSTVQNPQHSYATPGNYNVRLIVTSNNGCIDSLTKTVEVYTQPDVDFTFNAGTQCLTGNSFVFTNNSSVSATIVYQWFFGDGGTSTLQNPTHTYAAAGTYYVKLIVTTESSCTDSLTKQVTIINPSTIANAGPDQDLCNANTTTLAANNPLAGEITKWIRVSGPSQVVFSDSTAPNTTISNLQPGTYVLVWSITNGVCASAVDTMRVIIRPVIVDSMAAVTVTLCRGQSITVGGPKPTGGNGTYSYIWQQSFDGINWTTIPGAIDSFYTFIPLDSIQIRRIVTSGPCSNISSVVNILVQTPIVTNTITADHNICINTAPPLLVGSFPTGSDGAYFYQWQVSTNSGSTWTDIPGATAKDFQPGILSQNTMYRRIVRTLLCTGPEANTSNVVTITMNITDGTFTYAGGFTCRNNTVQFTVTPINGTEFTWNFGDGTPLVTTTSLTISHAYTNAGLYIPKVTIRNPITGCTKNLTGIDTIKVDHVVADYSVENFVTCNGTSTNFTNLSTAFFGLGTYNWDFGDGTTSTDKDPYHIYAGPGTYIVRLIVTGKSGCVDTIAKEVPVTFFITPDANVVAPDDICVKSSITYGVTLTPGDAISTYKWTLSNGLTSTNSSVTTSFNNVVPVLATVIIRTVNGCYDTATKIVSVRPLPVVKANVDTTICFGGTKQLNTTGAVSYQWDANSTLSCLSCPNPVAIPSSNALYIVTGTSQYGCIAKDSVYVNVVQPVHVLAAKGDTICVGRTTRLNASGAAQYQWFPTTGLSSATVSNPIAQPTITTNYTVVGKDLYNCFTDTGHVQVVVGTPSGVYAGPDTLMESGMTLQMSPTIINGPAISYAWSPATNLSCSNCPNPVAAVKGDMTYILTITNRYGCRTSDTLRILTFCPDAQVFIPNILTPDGDGLNDYLVVRGKGVKTIKSFTIYNRWGQIVYQNENFVPNVRGKSWDGKFKGQLVDSDVFVYICEAVCENGRSFLFKGNITVIK